MKQVVDARWFAGGVDLVATQRGEIPRPSIIRGGGGGRNDPPGVPLCNNSVTKRFGSLKV